LCESIHLSHNGPFASVTITTTKTPWWWHMCCAGTCCRIDNGWRIHLVHVVLVLQTTLIVTRCTGNTILKY